MSSQGLWLRKRGIPLPRFRRGFRPKTGSGIRPGPRFGGDLLTSRQLAGQPANLRFSREISGNPGIRISRFRSTPSRRRVLGIAVASFAGGFGRKRVRNMTGQPRCPGTRFRGRPPDRSADFGPTGRSAISAKDSWKRGDSGSEISVTSPILEAGGLQLPGGSPSESPSAEKQLRDVVVQAGRLGPRFRGWPARR